MFYENLDRVLIAFATLLLLGLTVCGLAAIKTEVAAREKFMTECRQDRKEYECVVLWRAGEGKTVPVFFPIITPRR